MSEPEPKVGEWWWCRIDVFGEEDTGPRAMLRDRSGASVST